MPAMPAARRTLTLSMPADAYGMPAPNVTLLWRCLRCLQLAEPSHCRCLPMPMGCLHPQKPCFGDACDACSSQNPHTVDACRSLQDASTQRNHALAMPAMPAAHRTLTLSMPADAYGMPTPNETMTLVMPTMPAARRTLTLSMPADAYGMRTPNETMTFVMPAMPAARRTLTLSMPAASTNITLKMPTASCRYASNSQTPQRLQCVTMYAKS